MVDIIKELDEKSIQKIINLLDNGGVISFPTETVYALAADATNRLAVEKIYAIKERNKDKSLPILVGDINQAKQIAEFNEKALKLALHYFPGPLTLVLNIGKVFNLAGNVNDGKQNIGIRMPNHKEALKILQSFGKPLVGTSANISSQASSISGEEVIESIGDKLDLIVDLGKVNIGIHSTILDLTKPTPYLLRKGAIEVKELEKFLNEKISNP